MKFSTLLMIALAAVIAVPLKAAAEGGEQREYLEIYSPGKSWKFCKYNLGDQEVWGYNFHTVVGDTVVNGQTCRLVEVCNAGTPDKRERSYAVYEDNGKVYKWVDDEFSPGGGFRLMMDISAHIGDTFRFDECAIADENVIIVNGTRRKRLSFSERSNKDCWVEGIGYSNQWADLTTMYFNSNVHVMMECYQDGELIFSREDFNAPIAALSADYPYTPMVVEGRTWWYAYFDLEEGSYNNLVTFDCGIRVEGDSIVDGVAWKKLNFVNPDLSVSPLPCGLLREEEHKVYFHPIMETAPPYALGAYPYHESKIYDFDLEVGDDYTIGYGDTRGMKVQAIETETFGDSTFKVFVVGDEICSYRILMGIGLKEPPYVFCIPFKEQLAYWPYPSPTLSWVTDGPDHDILYKAHGTLKPWIDYRPLVEEGKTWWYEFRNPGETTPGGTFSLKIEGDTIMDGVKWKKCWYRDSKMNRWPQPVALLIEGRRRVYYRTVDAGSEMWGEIANPLYAVDWRVPLIYDFTLETGSQYSIDGDGSAIPASNPFAVSGIRETENSGRVFKVMDSAVGEIVEGVGVTSNGVFCSPFKNGDTELTLLWVTEGADNEVYYEAAGGEQPWKTQGVASAVAGGDGEVVSIVDLAGRRIDRPAAGIYIVTTRNDDGTLTSRKVAIK